MKTRYEGPRAVDVYVGSRIRTRRTQLGLSQQALGTAVGLTFQQIQKYERGANRVGASRLYQLSIILDVPPGFFFDAMPRKVAETAGKRVEIDLDKISFQESRAGLELMRHFHALNPGLRKVLLDLARKLDKMTRTRVTGTVDQLTEDELNEAVRASAN